MGLITITTKQCTKCKEYKDLDQFYKESSIYNRYSASCKPCILKRNALWIANNPNKRQVYLDSYNNSPKRKSLKRGNQLRAYWPSLNAEQALAMYNRILSKQNHSCALCLIPRSSLSCDLAVDHCHKTGKVRGLLCNKCNRSIVRNHDINSVTKLLKYLKRFK